MASRLLLITVCLWLACVASAKNNNTGPCNGYDNGPANGYDLTLDTSITDDLSTFTYKFTIDCNNVPNNEVKDLSHFFIELPYCGPNEQGVCALSGWSAKVLDENKNEVTDSPGAIECGVQASGDPGQTLGFKFNTQRNKDCSGDGIATWYFVVEYEGRLGTSTEEHTHVLKGGNSCTRFLIPGPTCPVPASISEDCSCTQNSNCSADSFDGLTGEVNCRKAAGEPSGVCTLRVNDDCNNLQIPADYMGFHQPGTDGGNPTCWVEPVCPVNPGPAEACIKVLSTEGGKVYATPLMSLDVGANENDDYIAVAVERTNVVTTGDINMDNGVLPEGTCVNSYMVFLDSEGSNEVAFNNIQFELGFKILGTMSDEDGTLEQASTAQLGNVPGTTYPSNYNNRGLESNDANDAVSFEGSQLTVSMRVTAPGDWVRVVTECGTISVCPGGNPPPPPPPPGGGGNPPGSFPCLTTTDPTQGMFITDISSTVPDQTEANKMLAFLERKNVMLPEALEVDGNKFIAQGTKVNSFMVFLDPVDSQLVEVATKFNFGTKVLGTMSDQAGSLEQKSQYLAKPGVVYPASVNNRGHENGDARDFINPDPTDDRVLEIGIAATFPGDWIRVITEAADVDCRVTRTFTGDGSYHASTDEVPEACCNGKSICIDWE